MNVFIESYNDLVQFADSIIRKKQRPLLYNAEDVVHEAYLQSSADDTISHIRRKVYYIALAGTIYSCGNAYWENDTIIKPLEIWAGLEEKVCKKCRQSKILSQHFNRIYHKRVGVGYYTYSAQCKQCEGARPKSTYSLVRHAESQKKQQEELSDKYIISLLKNSLRNRGRTITMRTITPQMIALKRMEIIEKRIIQTNKRNQQYG